MIGPLPCYCDNHHEEKRMAKQKLTPEKRALLRKALAAKVKAGIGRSEILKSLSTQFGITTEGMRWYYKEAAGTNKPKKAVRKASAAKPSQNGSSLHLPEILNHSEGELRR